MNQRKISQTRICPTLVKERKGKLLKGRTYSKTDSKGRLQYRNIVDVMAGNIVELRGREQKHRV